MACRRRSQRQPALDLKHEVGEGLRAGEEEALIGKATQVVQNRQLLFCFNAFSDDAKTKGAAHRDDRVGDHSVIGITRQVAHEQPIDLQLRQRQALQVDK